MLLKSPDLVICDSTQYTSRNRSLQRGLLLGLLQRGDNARTNSEVSSVTRTHLANVTHTHLANVTHTHLATSVAYLPVARQMSDGAEVIIWSDPYILRHAVHARDKSKAQGQL